ncbi:N-acetylmuramoyl-L-alanine amidase [Sulfurovum indicum]|uniref:N-acetylmuramoyl-L-alanine amidase n=2 Tax=Sulfurovaceae TaxID=2771472 RepID=A0A7M1S6I1_9BACT|nr:N-acetylmuramoyl-L-alanine amidase [Sulfurovum indicum]
MLFASVTILEKVEIKKEELRLHFNKGYNKSDIHHFSLKNPYREVFDIPDVRLKNSRVGKYLRTSRCHSIRISQYKRNTVRIVMETERAYGCTPYRPLFAYNSYHIPLPPFKVSKKHYKAKKSSKPKTVVKKTYGKKKWSSKKAVKPKPYVIDTSKNIYQKGSGELIVIDAGHGGHDTGAIAGRKREKDLVLQIAKRLEKQLKKRGYRVYMTRRTDKFLKLPQRTRIADRKDAKVFISIHANSVPKRKRNKIHGVETFFLQKTRDAKSQRIAARENKAVLKGAGSSLSKKVIIDSVLNGPKIIESNKLAIDVQRRMMANLRAHYRGVRDGGVRHAPFWVLVGASRPSILIEVGYISHPKERKRLFTSRYQELIAKGIAEGVQNYLNNRKREIEL